METNISSHQSQLQQAATGQEMEPKGIVLNRMYTGSYLSTNLGHVYLHISSIMFNFRKICKYEKSSARKKKNFFEQKDVKIRYNFL